MSRSSGRGVGSIRASLPWTRTGDGAVRSVGERKPFDVHAELHARRTLAQLEELLSQRLAELRADPPRGYPR